MLVVSSKKDECRWHNVKHIVRKQRDGQRPQLTDLGIVQHILKSDKKVSQGECLRMATAALVAVDDFAFTDALDELLENV